MAKAPGTDRTLFVSKSGSDSNDGLSVASALLTVTAAIAALPNGGTIRVGWGDFALGVKPANGTVIIGASRVGTYLRQATNGVLLPMVDVMNCTFTHIGFKFASDVTGTLLQLHNCFSNHFVDVTISGTWSDVATSSNNQIGVHLKGNAGDNVFSDFVIHNLGTGVQIDSQTNFFSYGKLTNCWIFLQGGDPAGNLYQAGVEFDHVVFNGTGSRFINLNGTSQSWIFTDVWCDGFADKGVVIGDPVSHYGPGLVSFNNSAQIAAKNVNMEINAVATIVLDAIRFGAAQGFTPAELVIAPAGAPAGFAYGLKSGQLFDFPDSVFPPAWTVIGRGKVRLPSATAGDVAHAGSITAAPSDVTKVPLKSNSPAGTTANLWEVGKGGTVFASVDRFGISSASAFTGSYFDFAGSTLPAASVSERGRARYVEGATGVADGLFICVKDAANTYSWKQITLA